MEMFSDFGAEANVEEMINAARNNKPSAVSLLCRYRGLVNETDGLGRSALHTAAICGHVEVVKVLLEQPGIDVERRTYNNHDTALTLAADANNLEVMRLLLQRGCDVNAKDILSNTALHYTAINGSTEGVELLLAAGCDSDPRNDADATPLWCAVARENEEVCKILLRHDVDLSIESTGLERGDGTRQNDIFHIFHQPRSILWVAVERNCPAIIDLLINSGKAIHEETWILTQYSSTGNPNRELQQRLTELALSPSSLQLLCKAVILKLYSRDLSNLPPGLYLPSGIRSFLVPV